MKLQSETNVQDIEKSGSDSIPTKRETSIAGTDIVTNQPIEDGLNKKLKFGMLCCIVLLHIVITITQSHPKTLYYSITNSFNINNNAEFQEINTFFSFAQIIAYILAAGVIDTYGYSVSLPLFVFIATLSTIITASGYHSKLWIFVLLGRVLLGLSLGPLKVTYQSLIKKWISTKHLSIAFTSILVAKGFGITISGFLNNLLNLHHALSKDEHKKLYVFGWIMSSAQVLCGILAFAIIYFLNRLSINNPIHSMQQSETNNDQFDIDITINNETITKQDNNNIIDNKSDESFWTNNFIYKSFANAIIAIQNGSTIFWLLILTLITTETTFEPFNNSVAGLITNGDKIFALAGGAFILTPFISTIIDRFLSRSTGLMIAIVLMSITNISVYCLKTFNQDIYLDQYKWILFSLKYLSHCTIGSVIFPALTFAGHPNKMIGSVLAVANAFSAANESLCTWLIPKLHFEFPSMLYFSIISFVFGIIVVYMDRKNNNILDGPKLSEQTEVKSDSGSTTGETKESHITAIGDIEDVAALCKNNKNKSICYWMLIRKHVKSQEDFRRTTSLFAPSLHELRKQCCNGLCIQNQFALSTTCTAMVELNKVG